MVISNASELTRRGLLRVVLCVALAFLIAIIIVCSLLCGGSNEYERAADAAELSMSEEMRERARAARDEDASVQRRVNAVEYLGDSANPDAVPVLIAVIENHDNPEYVLLVSAIALGKLADATAVPSLERLQRHPTFRGNDRFNTGLSWALAQCNKGKDPNSNKLPK